jgi:membrane associated rhomboid family serine protease
VLWSVLALTTVFGFVTAGSRTAAGALFDVLACEMDRALAQPWRLLSAALLAAPPERWSLLLFSVLGLYFLGAPLEERWGPRRFLWFTMVTAGLGNLAAVTVDRLVGYGGQVRFHPGLVHGPAAVIAALSIAWAREFAHQKVNLFFVVPMQAKSLVWLALALCALNFVYPEGTPEGAIAPFGGLMAGYCFGGSPSPARRLWLRIRLALLRRGSGGSAGGPRRTGGARDRSKAKSRPPLSVIPGGLEDIFENRTPPKDKRDLN